MSAKWPFCPGFNMLNIFNARWDLLFFIDYISVSPKWFHCTWLWTTGTLCDLNDMNSPNKSTWTKCELIINILSKVKCILQLRNIPWHFSAADENKTEDEIALVNLRQWMFANQIIEAGKLYMQQTKQMMHAEISLRLIANIYFVILKFQILHFFY